VTGDIIFGQDADLYVGDPLVPPGDPNWRPSSLTVYLDGDLEGKNAGGINNLSQIPANFILFGTGPEDPPYHDWDIKNSHNFYGVYCGANVDIIIRAYADVFGSFSGHSYDIRNSGNLHYDASLSDLSAYDTGFAIERWWEDFVTQSEWVRIVFDSVVRKSTIRRRLVDGSPYAATGSVSLTVYYYDSAQNSPQLDGYATFRKAGSTLVVDHGNLQPGTWEPECSPSTVTLLSNVQAINFSVDGVSVQMTVTFENSNELTFSAARHNDWRGTG
jgi:hypothetical protein